MVKIAVGILAVASVLWATGSPVFGAPLVAHEWGTFTALQNDDGEALGAINADDEPVPDFVYTLGAVPTRSARTQLTESISRQSKGITACHPDVTMRLETPVIYFYPAQGSTFAPVDVRVTFHGGWLTEFYPYGNMDTADRTNAQGEYPPLKGTTSGSLSWDHVQPGAAADLVATDDAVWTAPREVAQASIVKVPMPVDARHPPESQAEKFLFYRGVGHLDSPLRVVRDVNTDRLSLHADLGAMRGGEEGLDLRVSAAWLIEIRPGDGACAFRAVPGTMDLHAPAGDAMATLPASFAPGDFGAGRMGELHTAMHGALVAAGLFPDEATAMLKTWELSYFKSPGRRLFYVTPRAWTEQVLPLSIDGATITRAMIGRIELVTPAQRESLARVAAGPCPDMAAFAREYRAGLDRDTAWSRRIRAEDAAGHQRPYQAPTFAELEVAVPPVYQDYLDLGRFRDALVLDEQRRRPTAALAAFISGNSLRAPNPERLTLSSFLPGHENAR